MLRQAGPDGIDRSDDAERCVPRSYFFHHGLDELPPRLRTHALVDTAIGEQLDAVLDLGEVEQHSTALARFRHTLLDEELLRPGFDRLSLQTRGHESTEQRRPAGEPPSEYHGRSLTAQDP